MKKVLLLNLVLVVLLSACTSKKQEKSEINNMFTDAKGEVKIMTLDPGHFHAALVQKVAYEQVDPEIYVFAPEGEDVEQHLKRIEAYNTRAENPTNWEEIVYKGDDFFEKMLAEKPGNVMVISGNNAKKTDYILETIKHGVNVLADKPMVITPAKFAELEEAFRVAEENGSLLYDIMTERHEVTTILQKKLSEMPEVFGNLQAGSLEEPAITKESVHHLFKYVSGNPLKRPQWFFDVNQQGKGVADVGTHLVDLIQWEAFPEVVLSKEDVEIISSKEWATPLTPEMFEKVTGSEEFPSYLGDKVQDGVLNYYCNGEVNYKLKGVYAKVSVIWNFEAPEGTGDTHYSIMRGTLCNLIIKQGADEGYKPKLYIKPEKGIDLGAFEIALAKAVTESIASEYPGVSLDQEGDGLWAVDIPEKYKVGHEAHFGQVTEKYLQYLVDGKLPEWEVPNMIVKYYTTTEALKKAVKE